MERDRIPELDLLRFTAAAGVVLFHAMDWPEQATTATAVSTYGFLGVPLFFMISGFVILMTAQHRGGAEFVTSRIARLYPSFWISVLLTALALAYLAHRPPSLATIAANLTMQPRMVFDEPYLDPVYWTLVVEMKFYLLTWLLIVTKQMKRVETWLALWLALGAFSAFVSVPHWVNSLLIPMWASLFSGGCLLYLIRSRGATKRRLITFAVSAVLSMYWSLQYQAVYTHSTSFSTQFIVLAIVLGLHVLLLSLALRKWSLPRADVWISLGCLTYPLYLVHAKAGHQVWKQLGGDEWTRTWLVLALVLAVSIVMAVFIERRVSPAFHKLLNRTTQRALEKLGLAEEHQATAMR